jgi:hypothetical protein
MSLYGYFYANSWLNLWSFRVSCDVD